MYHIVDGGMAGALPLIIMTTTTQNINPTKKETTNVKSHSTTDRDFFGHHSFSCNSFYYLYNGEAVKVMNTLTLTKTLTGAAGPNSTIKTSSSSATTKKGDFTMTDTINENVKNAVETIGFFADSEKVEVNSKALTATLNTRLETLIETIGAGKPIELAETFRNAFGIADDLELFGSDLELTATGQKKSKSRKQNLVRRINTAWKNTQKDIINTPLRFKGQSFEVTPITVTAVKSFDQALVALFDKYDKPYSDALHHDIMADINREADRVSDYKAAQKLEFANFTKKRDAENLFRDMNAAGLKFDADTVKRFLTLKGEKVTVADAKEIINLV